jgi:hypothetical protein
MCSPALTIRDILEGKRDADAYKEMLKNLKGFPFQFGWQGDEMQRQLRHLQDLGKAAGLALWSSFSSLPSRSYYPNLHQRNHTLHYTQARFGPLHLTGASTKTPLKHKNSFLISPCHVSRSLSPITQLISSTSSCRY